MLINTCKSPAAQDYSSSRQFDPSQSLDTDTHILFHKKVGDDSTFLECHEWVLVRCPRNVFGDNLTSVVGIVQNSGSRV